jgi:hypothetical protein
LITIRRTRPGEIVALPVAVHVRLARAQGAAEYDLRIKARAAHADGHLERGCDGDGAESFHRIGIDQAQPAVANFAQLAEQ